LDYWKERKRKKRRLNHAWKNCRRRCPALTTLLNINFSSFTGYFIIGYFLFIYFWETGLGFSFSLVKKTKHFFHEIIQEK